MSSTFFFVLLTTISLQSFAIDELEYRVHMKWDPQTNSLSISENAIGLPPPCENCVAPIEWFKCGTNLTEKSFANGQRHCETINDSQGFGIDIKFNNAANCTSTSQPYKSEWALFVNNLPNGVTGVRTANFYPINDTTTVSITCEINTPPLKLLKVHSLNLNDILYDALTGALYADIAPAYGILDGKERFIRSKVKMDVMKSKRVEYRLRQYEDKLIVLASTSREGISLPIPKSYINPLYDIWALVTTHPPMDIHDVMPESIGPGCQSLSSNTQDKQVAINFTNAGDPGTCLLDNDKEYWLVWYVFERMSNDSQSIPTNGPYLFE